jgi:hypothetical protein
MVVEVYKWLISPVQSASVGSSTTIECEPFQLNAAAQSLPKAMELVMRDIELVISEWAPIHLYNLLKQWFWKPKTPDIPVRDVWQHMCRHVYLPRLKAESVFRATIQTGSANRDFFGLAQGKEGDRYLGFSYGAASMPFMDAAAVLISPETSTANQAKLDAEKRKREELAGVPGTGQPVPASPITDDTPTDSPTGAVNRPKTRFYASIDLDPHGTKLRFNDIADNVIRHLAERPDTRVTISIDIQAETNTGFQEDVQRILKENCNTLQFRNAEFEE